MRETTRQYMRHRLKALQVYPIILRSVWLEDKNRFPRLEPRGAPGGVRSAAFLSKSTFRIGVKLYSTMELYYGTLEWNSTIELYYWTLSFSHYKTDKMREKGF